MTNTAFSPLRQHDVIDWSEYDARMRHKVKRRAKRKRGAPKRPEDAVQMAFVRWARKAGLELQHQNNGDESPARRRYLHLMGCTNGAADVLIFDPLPAVPEARGLALEFKSSKGVQSEAQVGWQRRIERLGWRYHVVQSVEEAKRVVRSYGLGNNF